MFYTFMYFFLDDDQVHLKFDQRSVKTLIRICCNYCLFRSKDLMVAAGRMLMFRQDKGSCCNFPVSYAIHPKFLVVIKNSIYRKMM